MLMDHSTSVPSCLLVTVSIEPTRLTVLLIVCLTHRYRNIEQVQEDTTCRGSL